MTICSLPELWFAKIRLKMFQAVDLAEIMPLRNSERYSAKLREKLYETYQETDNYYLAINTLRV
jgi:hypothetical protein